MLGGNSLQAAQLITRICESLRIEISLRTFFEHSTIAELSKVIDTDSTSSGEDRVLEKELSESEMFPLSFSQQRLWFLDRLSGGSSEYNIPWTLLLKGEIDLQAMEEAINTIINRHQSLRTHFSELKGNSYQVASPVLRIKVPVVDIRKLSTQHRDDLLIKEARDPFDLEKLPLIRAKLFAIDENKHILLCTIHHIVSDGWSVGVFFNELGKLYNAFRSKSNNPLAPLPIQYNEYSEWQREWFQGDVLNEQLAFWKDTLSAAAGLELPTYKPRLAVRTFNGATHSFSLSEDLSSRLVEFNRSERVTPFMALLATFQVLLFRYSGQDDILVGTPVANRQKTEFEQLIGFFVNTLVMRADLSGNPGFRELVKQVHCVNEILQIQPNGPYNIVGYSFGGLIAFETASQLQEKSGEEAKVLVFDSRLRVQKRYSVFQRIKWALNLFRQERFNYMRYVARELGNQVGQRFGLTDKTPIQKIFERTIGNVKRIKSDPYHKKYLPRPCPVEVVVLTARDTEYAISSGNEIKFWSRIALNGATYLRIDTDFHTQILDSVNYDQISNFLQDLLPPKQDAEAG